MSSYLNTTFVFKNTGTTILNLIYAMVYADSGEWVFLDPDGAPPNYDCNVGIGWYELSKPNLGPSETCTANMKINAGVVNSVPYSSDKCSLLFGVHGSDVHLDIHADGGIAHKGIYGPTPKAVEWDCKLHKVGGANEFHLKGNPAK